MYEQAIVSQYMRTEPYSANEVSWCAQRYIRTSLMFRGTSVQNGDKVSHERNAIHMAIVNVAARKM